MALRRLGRIQDAKQYLEVIMLVHVRVSWRPSHTRNQRGSCDHVSSILGQMADVIQDDPHYY